MSANTLLDAVKTKLSLKTDANLAKKLGFAPPVISKVRKGRMPVGATMIISIHEETGWTSKEIKAFLKPEEVAA